MSELEAKPVRPVTSTVLALRHQLYCGGVMLAGHLGAQFSQAAGTVMSHPVTNIGLMGLAALCWWHGDKDWQARRGGLSSRFESATARSVIAAVGLGMMVMHTPGLGLHDHHNHHEHQAHVHTPEIDENVTDYLESLDPHTRELYQSAADQLGMSLEEYASTMCGPSTRQSELVDNTYQAAF